MHKYGGVFVYIRCNYSYVETVSISSYPRTLISIIPSVGRSFSRELDLKGLKTAKLEGPKRKEAENSRSVGWLVGRLPPINRRPDGGRRRRQWEHFKEKLEIAK